MTLAEAIQTHISALPPHLQREALDYIAFLESRHGIKPPMTDTTPATEDFIARHAGTLGDDFPDDIDTADLGLDAPREAL